MRKRMYGKLTALALAGAMVLSGCGQSGGNSGTSTADSKAETSASSGAETSSEKKPESIGRTDIISANSSDIRSMDPQVGVDSPSATLNYHIYNGLIKIDDNREPVGDLAESFEIVDDTKYKFKLRKGVKFHNGDELKASDVKFSLERAKTMPKAMSNASAIDHVSVDGDYEAIHMEKLRSEQVRLCLKSGFRMTTGRWSGLMTTLMDLLQPLRLQPGSFRKEVLVQSHWKQGRLM